MSERRFEDRLRGYFSAEVEKVEPAGWWHVAISRLKPLTPSVSIWERLTGVLSKSMWRYAVPVAVIAIVGVVLWQMGIIPMIPASRPSQVDFVKLNGITYLSDLRNDEIDTDGLSFYSEVRNRLRENIPSGYQLKDGDAAFLDAGTPVYTISGYAPTFRLAAMRESKWFIYEADTNPNAQKGADFLDIGGKVESISVNSETDGISELASIEDAAEIEQLVQLILDASVNQLSKPGSERYFLDFHLKDGTTTKRAYWLDTGVLSRGIQLPEEFGATIRAALNRR